MSKSHHWLKAFSFVTVVGTLSLCLAVWLSSSSGYVKVSVIGSAEKPLISCPETDRKRPSRSQNLSANAVHVLFAGDQTCFLGMVTSATSILQNTQSDVMFHFVTLKSLIANLSAVIDGTIIKNSSHEVIEFNAEPLKGNYIVRSPRTDLSNPLNFARLFLPELLPTVARVIYLDADTLVLGDIKELFELRLADGHVVAMLNGSVLDNRRNFASLVINFSNPYVQELNMPRKTDLINNGVVVADLVRWRQLDIMGQLVHWMKLNVISPVVKYGDFGSGSQAIMLLALFDKYTPLPQEWNVLNGYHGRVKVVKLIHWNGSFKPWKIKSKKPESLWWMFHYLSHRTSS